MKNSIRLIKEMMDMSAATRGISMSMLREQFSQRTIDKCLKKEYIQLLSWFEGNFDTFDKEEHKYKARSGGIYIPTSKGIDFYNNIEKDEQDILTDKELCRASDMDEGY